MQISKAILGEIAGHAHDLKVPTPHLLAVVEVESNGQVLAGLTGDRANYPLIRWEGHYFFRRLTGKVRDEAVRLKLAHAKAGGVKNPSKQSARYALLDRAVALCQAYGVDSKAAYESISWGVGQVMGAHWDALGYASITDFVKTVTSGLGGQVEVMARFIRVNKLDDELRDGRWASFARGYNGPNYRVNAYDTKMAAAAKRWAAELTVEIDGQVYTQPVKVAKPDGMLRLGSKGQRVREVQALLVRAGYAIKTDGDFGPSTRDALKGFQRANGLIQDGVYGPKTEQALAKLRTDPEERPGYQRIADVPQVQAGVAVGGGALAGIVGIKETLEQAVEQIAPLSAFSGTLQTVQGALVLAATAAALGGAVYALWGLWKSKQTVEV